MSGKRINDTEIEEEKEKEIISKTPKDFVENEDEDEDFVENENFED